MENTENYGYIRSLLKSSIERQIVALCGLVVITVIMAAILHGSSKKSKFTRTISSKINSRELGHWTPNLTFKTPIPTPYKNWDINLTPPLPYRAFKHKYTINMGIRNMSFDDWIELDNEWLKFHNHKLERVKTRGIELYETSHEAMDAVYELLDEFYQYLPNRYPTLFKQRAYGLENLVTGEKHKFKHGFRHESSEDPILTASKMVQDDLAVMLESENGTYYMKAGAILLAGFWRFRDKYQMPLSTIHTSGSVPQFNEKLKNGMEKFFIRQTCDKPVVRNNYFIQTDDNLPWSHSIGSEESKDIGWYTAKKAKTVDQLYFRSERQSLRRLPKTGAIIFTIRTYFLPITEMCKEDHIPRRLLNGMTTWGDDVKEYKGWDTYKDVIIPYLEQVAKEQESKGIVLEKDQAKYPF